MINIENGLHFNIRFLDVRNHPYHYHANPEIVFLLSGRLHVQNGPEQHIIKAGDIYIMNTKDLHHYSGFDEPNVTMILEISNDYYKKIFPDFGNNFFVTDLHNPNSNDMNNLRNILSSILMESLLGEKNNKENLESSMHDLISLLLVNFQNFRVVNNSFMNVNESRKNTFLAERISHIQDIMYYNHSSNLTLEYISKQEFLSTHYLSHLIKECIGLGFMDFLCFVRVEESENLLFATDMKESEIAKAVGFSALRYYQKHFERWYGVSPEEHRRHLRKNSLNTAEVAMIPCDTDTVISALNKLTYTAYRADFIAPQIEAAVIETEINDSLPAQSIGETPLGQYCAKHSGKDRTAAWLYDLFSELGEILVSCGKNYIISRNEEGGASILLYHAEELLHDSEEKPFIFKIHGLTGNYRISRARLNKSREDSAGPAASKPGGKRTEVLQKIAAYPKVSTNHATINGSLTIDINTADLYAELILIDKE